MLGRKRASTDDAQAAGRRIGRFAGILAWVVAPLAALAIVVGYFGLAIARHVNPPVVPVVGISMQPLLHAGDLVFLKHVDPATLKKGDIIAFHTTSTVRKQYGVPDSYVHRIVKVEKGARGYQFRTKGDNVAGPDPFWTVQQDVIGMYSGRIKHAGYPVLFIHSRQGIILAGALGLIGVVYLLLGFFDRRAAEREATVVEFASMVEEVRQLAGAMAAPGDVVVHRSADRLPRLEISDTLPADWSAPDSAPPRTPPVAAAPAADDRATLRELVSAVSEYGEHLRSHTAVMKNLAATTGELQQATVDMRRAIEPASAAAVPGHPVPSAEAPQSAPPRRLLLPPARSAAPAVDAVTARARESLADLEQALAALRQPLG